VCRINAEDPHNFTPCPGKIITYHAPGGPGIRVDSHIYQGYVVPHYYDSMIAKIISFGESREIAIAKMQNALKEIVVEGIKTNVPLQQRILSDTNFQKGGTNIHYLEKLVEMLEKSE
jgi:acetyl-CoA carboxylase, biotin carboxylase subunit